MVVVGAPLYLRGCSPARLDVNHGRADVWGTMQVEVFLTLLDDYIL